MTDDRDVPTTEEFAELEAKVATLTAELRVVRAQLDYALETVGAAAQTAIDADLYARAG